VTGRSTLCLPICLVALGALLSGCHHAHPAPFKQPAVTFRDLRVRSIGLSGGAVDLVVTVDNPNAYALNTRRATYALMAGSDTVGQGASEEPCQIGATGTADMHLPLSFAYSELGAAGKQVMNSGTVLYRVVGTVTLLTPSGSTDVPYDRSGEFSTLNVTLNAGAQ
jgi:LEA14-like dessication related protein